MAIDDNIIYSNAERYAFCLKKEYDLKAELSDNSSELFELLKVMSSDDLIEAYFLLEKMFRDEGIFNGSEKR